MFSNAVLGSLVVLYGCLLLEGAQLTQHRAVGDTEGGENSSKSIKIKLSSSTEKLNGALKHPRGFSAAVLNKEETDLLNYHDFEYYGVVGIGSLWQPFNIAFDTSSSGLWLPSLECSNRDCGERNRFEKANSPSYNPLNKECNISYGLSLGSGLLGQDDLQIATDATIKSYTFCEVYELTVNSTVREVFDGILGLDVASSGLILRDMVEQKLIEQPIFSVYINQSPKARRAGELSFGIVDREHFIGDITYVPLRDSSQWQFKVDRVSIGEDFVIKENFEAKISTASAYITGTYKEIVSINKLLGFNLFDGVHFGSTNCSMTSQNVTFVIGGQNFDIKPNPLIPPRNKTILPFDCISPFKLHEFHNHEEKPWIFGSAFIASVYTVFDQGKEQIGFGKSLLS